MHALVIISFTNMPCHNVCSRQSPREYSPNDGPVWYLIVSLSLTHAMINETAAVVRKIPPLRPSYLVAATSRGRIPRGRSHATVWGPAGRWAVFFTGADDNWTREAICQGQAYRPCWVLYTLYICPGATSHFHQSRFNVIRLYNIMYRVLPGLYTCNKAIGR